MNTPNQEQDTVENSAYNPFPEPQTIPAGWDLSALSTSTVDAGMDEEDSAED
jgi:uncharacterized protein YbdZ (MbtH family)